MNENLALVIKCSSSTTNMAQKTWLKGIDASQAMVVVWESSGTEVECLGLVTRHSNQMRKLYYIPYKEHHEQWPDETATATNWPVIKQPPNDSDTKVHPMIATSLYRFADEQNETTWREHNRHQQ
ncbi:hypothetical protein niasHS_015751 [Heterodera schachtii]|uniref:Uncharacterized protein n=1 Tax=Heterodera schachtii TaxID=97005 RepID=A0ABD2I4T7_HETSC